MLAKIVEIFGRYESKFLLQCGILKATIPHINYWDQVNSWKNLWKFWNGPLSRNKSGPFPLLNVAGYWKRSSTNTCAKKMSQILANNTDNGGGALDSEFVWGIVEKNEWKIKEGLEKPGIFFSLRLLFLMIEICQMVLWIMVLSLWLLKKMGCQNYGEIWWIFIIKCEYSKYPICSFILVCYTARAPISFMNLFYGIHY